MNNIFDREYMKVNDLTFRYCVISLLLIIALISSLLIVKKDRIYQNKISFIDGKNALVLVDKNILSNIKDNKKIIINDISYEYSIEKIEENEEVYLVSIKFIVELQNIKANVYEINLGNESLLKYIIRIMKG